MAVGLAARQEFGLQRVHLVDEFLTHRLSQGVALAAGEVSQQARQQHDLFLIHGHAVGVLQVAVHARQVVDYGRTPMLSGDEFRYVVHRPRSVQGVHGDEVLELGGLQLAQVFLHAGRFKLERAYGASGGI